MPFILALDQGTTSSRAHRVRPRGHRPRASAQREFRQIFPQPGWVEHDADRDLGDAVGRPARGARPGAASARATSPRSASPTSARPRWSGTAPPAGRSPTRSSGRTGAPRRMCDALRAAGHAPLFARKTGLVLDAYFSGTKLTLAARPRARRARARANAASSRSAPSTRWLVWNLTGGARARHRRRRTPPARCCSTSTPATGTTSCSRCSTSRARCCRAVVAVVAASARTRRSAASTSRSPASPATSRRRSSARPASRPAWPRTPTAPAASCC